MDDEELLRFVTRKVVEEWQGNYSSLEAELVLAEEQLGKLVVEGEGLVKKMVALDEEQIAEFVSPRLKEISDEKKILEERRFRCMQELMKLREDVVLPEDVRYMISSLMGDFGNLNRVQQQRILEMIIERIEIEEDAIRVFFYGHKKNHLQPISGFEVISDLRG